MSLLLSSIIMSFSQIIIGKNLLCYREKITFFQYLLATLFISIPSIFLYEVDYNGIVTLLTFIFSIITYKKLLKQTYTNSLLLATFIMIILSIADIGWSIGIKFTIGIKAVREIWYVMIISNAGIGALGILGAKCSPIQELFQGLSRKLSKKVYISTIVFIILFFAVIILLHANMIQIFKSNGYYMTILITLTIFYILYYIYMVDKVNYDRLRDEYDSLFNCIQTFEIWIDKEQLGLHEMKNNLSIIRGMTKNKQIIQKIDEMLQDSIVIEKDWVEQLKNIPKGGIKGLLYYKMAIAKAKKVNLYVEVSPKISNKIKNIQHDMLKKLCILLGIYLDNAIEAAEETKKRQVTLEIYLCNKNLTFVLSNSYKTRPDINKINEKGFSTKGNGHGKGLYFAQKTLNKTKELEGSQQIMNDFFVQKLTVHSDL